MTVNINIIINSVICLKKIKENAWKKKKEKKKGVVDSNIEWLKEINLKDSPVSQVRLSLSCESAGSRVQKHLSKTN